MKIKNNIRTLAFLAALSFVIVFTGNAQEEKVSPTLEKAIGQYKHENYDEALVTLKKYRAEDPQSTLAAYYLGLTYKQVQDYKDAIPNLKDAVTQSPKIKGALIELIDCLYQVGELDEAKEWILEAEKEEIRPAQVAFLKGLVLAKEAKDDEAIAAFENAKSLDSSMAQACEYQIGLCHLKSRRFEDARRAFEDVVLIGPSSNMANFANEYMNAIEKRQAAERPFRISAGVAWQYDDNVVLKPDDDSVATNIQDKSDSREVFTAKAEYDKRLNDKFGINAQYMFYYGLQNTLHFYDMISNTILGQPKVFFENNSVLTFPTSYSHMIVNEKSYLSTPTTSAVYSIMVGKSNMAQCYVKYQYQNYLWSPSTADENRDGNNIGFGLGWYYFYAQNKGFLNLRYAFNNDWTEGNNWDCLGNRGSVTALIPVMDKLNLTLSGDIFVQTYANTNSLFNTKRQDEVYTVSSLLAYKFYKDSEMQLQYTYVKDSSNIGVYDYSRNVYSVGVELKF